MMKGSTVFRLYGVKNCPTLAMTATATSNEIQEVISAMGLRTLNTILSSNPIQAHIKFSMVRRPSNNFGLDGTKHYLEDLKHGRKPKNFIVFCRGNGVLGVDQLSVHHEPCQPNTSNMHANSERKLIPAMTFILKPYLYQETKNPDTIKILIRIQRQFLRSVAKSKGD